MSEFTTLTDLFREGRDPTRELEPIQKVDRFEQIERDIEEFQVTESAKDVLGETGDIIAGSGLSHRFRYVQATFGSGKSHLLKLIGVATGEMEGLEEYAYDLGNKKSGFKQFRNSLSESHIDHLQPLFMNLLDRDRDDTTLPVMLFEELGRRRGYYTSRTWLLEFCWRLDIEYELWTPLAQAEYEGLTLEDIVDRPSSLRPWLTQAIPHLDGAEAAGLGTKSAVEEAIEEAATAVQADSFDPYDLVERLDRTKRHLEANGEAYEFLIGFDEIAIYVGDQPRRYEEVVDTIEALIDGLNPPMLGTGQWSMRDMQRNFVGEVDEEAWYAQEIELEGADTETIVRKRWLQKSDPGAAYIDEEVLSGAQSIEPTISETTEWPSHGDPVEAYPFRDQDLRLLRATMQGLIKGDRETDREYIQGRALLVRVRSLFADHGWADREPGVIVPWDVLYDVIKADTALVPNWATDLIDRVGNTLDDPLATRTAKALFLLSQVDVIPRTADNLARLLTAHVDEDTDQLAADVETQLQALADVNLIREDVDTSPTTYTILSEEDIRFWQEVQQEATEMPQHQLRDNIQQFLQEADPDRLSGGESTSTGTFADVDAVPYSVRYSVDKPIPESVTDNYDEIVIRLIADSEATCRQQRERWQETNGGPNGREDVLITVEITEAIRQQIRQLIGMQTVLSGMADPQPEYRLQRQTLQEEIEDTIQERLHEAEVYTPTRESTYGSYLDSLDEVVTEAVDEKFPNRKTLEQPLQLDDLESLIAFFQEDGPWPLTDDDADLFGVNTVPRTISDGWTADFLDEFEGEERVSGEQVLETIEGRRGAFLGTPAEALHALLFILVADNRIEIRSDGERITDTGTIARIITNRRKLEDAVIGFDPEPITEGLDDVYEALLGETPDTDDAKVLLEEIADWADTNAFHIRTVVSRTNLEFGSNVTLDDLKTTLEPAFSGEELTADRLTNPTVVEQAELYGQVHPLFESPAEGEDSLWDQFEQVYETLKELYPTASVVKQMQAYASGSKIPDANTLEEHLDQAEDFRVTELQTLYERLTDSETTEDELESLRKNLTDAFADEALQADIETVEDHFENLELETLKSLSDTVGADTEALSESELADTKVRSEVETLANGRALLEAEDEDGSLYEQLADLEADLSESHEGFVTTQISRAVSGSDIPDVDRAQQLLSQGRNIQSGDGPDDEDEELQQLWNDIQSRDEGNIVVIDTEDNR